MGINFIGHSRQDAAHLRVGSARLHRNRYLAEFLGELKGVQMRLEALCPLSLKTHQNLLVGQSWVKPVWILGATR